MCRQMLYRQYWIATPRFRTVQFGRRVSDDGELRSGMDRRAMAPASCSFFVVPGWSAALLMRPFVQMKRPVRRRTVLPRCLRDESSHTHPEPR